jgi:hypothetical protein
MIEADGRTAERPCAGALRVLAREAGWVAPRRLNELMAAAVRLGCDVDEVAAAAGVTRRLVRAAVERSTDQRRRSNG